MSDRPSEYLLCQRAPNPPEFAARFEQVKRQSSPARGYNLGAFVLVWLVLRRREATNLGRFDLLKRGCANSVVGLELADFGTMRFKSPMFCAPI